MSTILYLCSLIPFYLLGAMPVGYVIAKAKGINITQVGSGNVGATNVARALGKKAGASTLLLDIAKGAFAVFLASLIVDERTYAISAGVAAVAGHCFSIPGKLRGGKGVATSLGAALVLSPSSAFISMGIFAVVFYLWDIVSLASVAAAITLPLPTLFTSFSDPLATGLGCISLIVVLRHYKNLKRLGEGTEPKFASKKKEPSAPEAQ